MRAPQTQTVKIAINDVLAENLRHYMKERGFETQAQLAKKVGVVQRTIGYYLTPAKRTPSASGKAPSAKLSEVESLAEALGVNVWELLMPRSERARFKAVERAIQAVSSSLHGDPSPPHGEHSAPEPASPRKHLAA